MICFVQRISCEVSFKKSWSVENYYLVELYVKLWSIAMCVTEICGKWEMPTTSLSVATKEQLTLTRQIYIRISQTCVDDPSWRVHSPRDSSESAHTQWGLPNPHVTARIFLEPGRKYKWKSMTSPFGLSPSPSQLLEDHLEDKDLVQGWEGNSVCVISTINCLEHPVQQEKLFDSNLA